MERLVDYMGVPETYGKITDVQLDGWNPFCMFWTHQRLPPAVKDIGERMTSAVLVKALEDFGKPPVCASCGERSYTGTFCPRCSEVALEDDCAPD